MSRDGRYPAELRERAVRMVLDHEHEYGSQWEAITSVAEKLGPTAETVRSWVRQAERDTGRRVGPTSDELAELRLPVRQKHPRLDHPISVHPRPGRPLGWTWLIVAAITQLRLARGLVDDHRLP